MKDGQEIDYVALTRNAHVGGALLGLSKANRATVAAELDGYVRMGEEYAPQRDAVRRRFVPDIQEEELKALVRETKRAADQKLNARLSGLDKHEKVLRDQLRAQAVEPEAADVATRIERAMLRAEIRAAARGLSDSAIEQLYRTGDVLVRQALEELPRVEVSGFEGSIVTLKSFVSDKLRGQLLEDIARRDNPALLAELRDVELIRAAHVAVHAALIAALPPDLVQDLRFEHIAERIEKA